MGGILWRRRWTRQRIGKARRKKKETAKEKEVKKGKDTNCPIHVAAAETIDSMFSEVPTKRTATKMSPKKVDSIEPKKVESTVAQKEPESSNDGPGATEA